MIYSYQCGETACDEEYIGETSRTLGERYWEHLKQPSPFNAHIQQTGHNSIPDNFRILGREDWGLTGTIKEAVYIRVKSGIESFLTPLANSQVYVHIHTNKHNQPNPTSWHPEVGIGHSGHTLNSEHVLRGS